ncbi:MAG: DUF6531 domain-containing protein [Actinomycetota bacterium]|nr:DUF6531 domain-containing protein [Actinomycetota bacterium]
MFDSLALNAAHNRFLTSRRRRLLLSGTVSRVGVIGLTLVLAIAGAGPANAAPAGSAVSASARQAVVRNSGVPTVKVTAARLKPPVVYNPSSSVNRIPTGSVPSGRWTPTSRVRGGKTGTAAATRPSGGGVTPAAAPVGTSAGPASLGILGGVGLENFPLESALTAQVNVGNGNLVITGKDLTIKGPGLSLNLTRFYNALSSGTGAFGPGWTMSTGRDVGLTFAGGNVTFTGPSGFQVTYAPAAGGGYVMPTNINADLKHNSDGTYTITYRSNNEKLTFTAGGFLTRDSDRNGNALVLGYNADNTLASVTDTAGRVTTFQYNGPSGGGGRITGLTDPSGRMVTYGYDGSGNLTSTRDYDGHSTTYQYDSSNRLTRIVTAANHIVDLGYDTAYRVSSVTRYLNGTAGSSSISGFAYPTATSTVETNPNNNHYTFTLDASGRPIKVTDPLGHSRAQAFTANGDLTTAADAMGSGSNPGNVTTYRYDSNNRTTGTATPTGAATKYEYDPSASCASTDSNHPYLAKCKTDAQGDSSLTGYDTAGNTTSVADTTPGRKVAATATATYQGDPKTGSGTVTCGGHPGQVCTSTTANGGLTTYAYNTNGDLVTVIPTAPLGAQSFTYDSLSRLKTATDGKSQLTTYSYNGEDAVTYTTWTGGDTDQRTYDNDGNLTQQTDNRAGTNSYSYDGLGRQTYYGETGNSAASTVTYDPAGNVLTASDSTGTVTYGYDTANELISLAEPGGTCPAGQYGTALCTRFDYDANGHLLKTTYPGLTTQTSTYDNSGRVLHKIAAHGSTVLSDLRYSYTAATAGGPGNSTDREVTQTRTDTLGVGAPAGSITTYGYDTQERLTTATEKTSSGNTNASWSYGYDPDGNRTSSSSLLSGATTNTSYGYNAADELASRNGSATGFTYDANGNETANPGNPSLGLPARSSTLNTRDQVTAVNTVTGGTNTNTPFTYVGSGNVERTSVGVPSQAGGLSTNNTLLGLSSQTPASTPTTSFTRTPGGTLVSIRIGGTSSYYYLTDAAGSVVGLVDANGTKAASYAYDPYGITRTATGPQATANPFHYISGYQDPSGLYKLGARYYDPSLGRFTQRDPSSQEANAYVYAANNPTNASDPSGLFTITLTEGQELWAAGIGLAIVAIIAIWVDLPAAPFVLKALLSLGVASATAIGGLGGTHQCIVINVDTFWGIPYDASASIQSCG